MVILVFIVLIGLCCVGCLVHHSLTGEEKNNILLSKSIWPELKPFSNIDEIQSKINEHRDCGNRIVFKSHLPIETLYYSNKCKCIVNDILVSILPLYLFSMFLS